MRAIPRTADVNEEAAEEDADRVPERAGVVEGAGAGVTSESKGTAADAVSEREGVAHTDSDADGTLERTELVGAR